MEADGLGGCWCFVCGAMLDAACMEVHIWQHGEQARIGQCDVTSPAPWSRHQGYWDYAAATVPFYDPTRPAADEGKPRQGAALWCLYCGALQTPYWMTAHVWTHGLVTLSRPVLPLREGAAVVAPISLQMVASQAAPVQPSLFGGAA